MPRRFKRGRGTRHPRGVYSGITLATIPSGVTIDRNDIETPDGFITHFGAKGYKWASGVVDQASAVSWGTGGSSNAYPVVTGLSGISTFQMSLRVLTNISITGMAVTPTLTYMSSGGGAVTVITYSQNTGAACLNKGVSAQWVAFGLA